MQVRLENALKVKKESFTFLLQHILCFSERSIPLGLLLSGISKIVFKNICSFPEITYFIGYFKINVVKKNTLC